MTVSENPAPQQPDVLTDGMSVRADGGYVVVEGVMLLTPEAAERSAERLLEAAEAARGSAGQNARKKPPFPPAELVSPHGAS